MCLFVRFKGPLKWLRGAIRGVGRGRWVGGPVWNEWVGGCEQGVVVGFCGVEVLRFLTGSVECVLDGMFGEVRGR